ncbi:BEM_HP_G0080370.mRNA.1.CDS.1 [Saccharomyces cerevisiae]|nr:BEM_HP_G0080370.mRNA.1.CDS.1 [Saccharomyces cerevisiae]CAI6992131.1 BEM_HP_G0080370.mRNA.1.CDS.1 [Saccharomyces cerevisiae]
MIVHDTSMDNKEEESKKMIKSTQEKDNINKEKNSQEERPTQRIGRHPALMTNGVRNKSLRELLGDSENSAENKKKFASVPVVIDPKLAQDFKTPSSRRGEILISLRYRGLSRKII